MAGAARCYHPPLLLGARNRVRGGPDQPLYKATVATVMTASSLSLFASAAAAGSPPGWVSFLPLVGMFLIFWFLILRPQMKRQKDLQAKIGGLKKGDQVLTAGGLLGKIVRVDENYVDLELGPNIKVKALRSTIADVVPPTGTSPAND
ncbi:protein translocase subunit yajC [Novosphingobium kunmingense]|uniref:Sec translocon accessory complex subunit YajC n=2 Tax=Novosphingobium kunmingense TaxID=1211806 RepID=A0A2N0I1N3_9SPHN|nr:protein translocase subunit yajC [Novosphingobium kunmingense]